MAQRASRTSSVAFTSVDIQSTNAVLVAWSSSDVDPVHFEQTTCLRLLYHQVQMVIHQPHIPLLSGVKATSATSPSLTICKHACQSVSRILDVWLQRGREIPPSCCCITFHTGMLSLIAIWDAKKGGLSMDTRAQTNDVNLCIRTLRAAESR